MTLVFWPPPQLHTSLFIFPCHPSQCLSIQVSDFRTRIWFCLAGLPCLPVAISCGCGKQRQSTWVYSKSWRQVGSLRRMKSEQAVTAFSNLPRVSIPVVFLYHTLWYLSNNHNTLREYLFTTWHTELSVFSFTNVTTYKSLMCFRTSVGFVFVLFCCHGTACGILASWLGIEPTPPAV